MTYELSVCVNDISERSYATQSALHFATQNKSHLTAVYIKIDEVQIRRWASSAPLSMAKQMLKDQDERECDAKLLFESLAKNHGCSTTWKTVNQSDSPFIQMMCTDYIFVSQPVNDDFSHRPDDQFITDLLLQTKRPIILIPNGWRKTQLAKNIVIGWNDSTIAMRAVADAVPLLRNARHVNVLKIIKKHRFSEQLVSTSPDIKTYLEAKGINSTLLVQADEKNTGDAKELLNFANNDNSDLIVIGGYSHSRFREVFFGGVTKQVLTESTVPVLVTH